MLILVTRSGFWAAEARSRDIRGQTSRNWVRIYRKELIIKMSKSGGKFNKRLF